MCQHVYPFPFPDIEMIDIVCCLCDYVIPVLVLVDMKLIAVVNAHQYTSNIHKISLTLVI